LNGGKGKLISRPVEPERRERVKLQEGIVINGMRLRNRLVLPPLTTNYGNPDGTVTEEILQFYRERSRDVGLTIVEASAVRPDGRLVPHSLGLWDDGQVAGMARLARAIKERGAAAMVQINHGGARCVPMGGELQGASPSGFALRPDVEPLVMNPSQIRQMVDAFGRAAARAVAAGFDGVEIHGAHFYLISQFLSPLTNRREDSYGGDARGRSTLALEVVRTIRERLGAAYPVLFRLNAMENVEGGQTLQDAEVASRLLAEAGVNALHVSTIAQSSWREVEGRRFPTMSSALAKDRPPGENVPLAARIKEVSGLPVIAVGKMGIGTVAEEALRDSKVDMVAIGRQMIADPDTAGKILAGKGQEVVACKECMNCFATIWKGAPMACKVHEGEKESS